MKFPPVIYPDLRLEHEVWLAPKGQTSYNQNGSKDRPFVIEYIEERIGENKVHKLLPGEYKTRGIALPFISAIVAPEKDVTILQDPNGRFNYPHVRSIQDVNGSKFSYLYGLTIDGNAQNFPALESDGNFKVEPIVIRAWENTIDSCNVINFGSNGNSYPDGLETFPITGKTWEGGTPWDKYVPDFAYLARNEPIPYVRINNCNVTKPHFRNGGYSSAIFVETSMPGNRFPFGVRDTVSALVENCSVETLGGIGYGAANADNCVWRNNRAFNCVCPFNADTGETKDFTFFNNVFVNCNTGPNFSVPLSGLNFIRNIVQLSNHPWFNTKLGKSDPSWMFRLLAGSSINVDSNLFVGRLEEPLNFEGFTPDKKLNTIINRSDEWSAGKLRVLKAALIKTIDSLV